MGHGCPRFGIVIKLFNSKRVNAVMNHENDTFFSESKAINHDPEIVSSSKSNLICVLWSATFPKLKSIASRKLKLLNGNHENDKFSVNQGP